MWQLIAHPIVSFSSIATMGGKHGFELHYFVVNPKLVRCMLLTRWAYILLKREK
jgi:hypothetical protein